jgi:hypothetical protein
MQSTDILPLRQTPSVHREKVKRRRRMYPFLLTTPASRRVTRR